MSAVDKAGFRSVLIALCKTVAAEPFLYPVDSKVFPAYYEMIKKPMDLYTVKERLAQGDYATLDAALLDLKQIWDNCRLFNAPGSAISATANELDAETARLVDSKLGPAATKMYKAAGAKKGSGGDGRGGGGAAKAASSSSSRKKGAVPPSAMVIPKKALQKILKDMKASEFAEPFLMPVNLKAAPGYLDYVSQPMDLSTLDKGVKAGTYEGAEGTALFATHARLIWTNCNAYNDPSSSIAGRAGQLGALFEGLFKDAVDAAVGVGAGVGARAGRADAPGLPLAPALAPALAPPPPPPRRRPRP